MILRGHYHPEFEEKKKENNNNNKNNNKKQQQKTTFFGVLFVVIVLKIDKADISLWGPGEWISSY